MIRTHNHLRSYHVRTVQASLLTVTHSDCTDSETQCLYWQWHTLSLLTVTHSVYTDSDKVSALTVAQVVSSPKHGCRQSALYYTWKSCTNVVGSLMSSMVLPLVRILGEVIRHMLPWATPPASSCFSSWEKRCVTKPNLHSWQENVHKWGHMHQQTEILKISKSTMKPRWFFHLCLWLIDYDNLLPNAYAKSHLTLN